MATGRVGRGTGRGAARGRLWGMAQVVPGAIALAIGVTFGYLAALAQVGHFVR